MTRSVGKILRLIGKLIKKGVESAIGKGICWLIVSTIILVLAKILFGIPPKGYTKNYIKDGIQKNIPGVIKNEKLR